MSEFFVFYVLKSSHYTYGISLECKLVLDEASNGAKFTKDRAQELTVSILWVETCLSPSAVAFVEAIISWDPNKAVRQKSACLHINPFVPITKSFTRWGVIICTVQTPETWAWLQQGDFQA